MKRSEILLLFLSVLIFQPALSQIDSTELQYAVKDTQNVNVRLFESDDPFEISLRFDITIYKRKKSDSTYLDAVLTYYDGKNDSVNKNIKLRARGEIRRTICDFPPMNLNFKFRDTDDDEFMGINKLKLVPYCKLGYEDYILREYLIYKLYNVLTNNSLKVRLLKINFINTAKKTKPISQFGFAIEPVKFFEKRTKSYELKTVVLSQKDIKPEIMDRFAIFNYMVGNTDWAVPNQHNAMVFVQPGSDRPELGLVVPHDFDYAGMVNADYAIPNENLPIKTVRERLYMGVCRNKEVFAGRVKEFLDKKDEFYRVINDFPYLSLRSKKDIINYLNGFYSLIDKRNSIVYEFLNQCHKM